MSPRRGNVRSNYSGKAQATRRGDVYQGSCASQFASSNSTLNAFLGGKQKSWMTQGANVKLAPSINRGPKPTAAPNSLPHGEPTTRASSSSTVHPLPDEPLPTPQPSSNSTSPHIPNTRRLQQNNSPASIAIRDTVLPSPAPSEKALSESPAQPEFNPCSLTRQDRVTSRDISSRSGAMVADSQSPPDLGKELNELVSRYGVEEVEKLLRSSNGSESRGEGSIVGSSPVTKYHSTTQENLTVANKRPSVTRTVNEKRQRMLPVPSSPQTPTEITPNSSLSNSSQARQQGPSLRPLLALINNFIITSGGESALGPLTLPRLSVLQDACHNEDYFYLVLHQIYCLHSTNRQAFLGIPGMDKIHVSGLVIVEQLVLPNQNFPITTVEWFASFPAPHQILIAHSNMYKMALKEVQNFLCRISQNWRRLQGVCRQRDYPPLVEELISVFGLFSVVFQRIVFTAIHRSIWGSEQDLWFTKSEALFRQDQQRYQENRLRMNTARPPSSSELKARHDGLVASYKAIRQHRNQSLPEHASQSSASTSANTNPSMEPVRVTPGGYPHHAPISALTNQVPSTQAFLENPPVPNLHMARRAPQLNINTQAEPRLAYSPTNITPQTPGTQSTWFNGHARTLGHPNMAPQSAATQQTPLSEVASHSSIHSPKSHQSLIPKMPIVTPTQPHPITGATSLHQAHLRSPTYHPALPKSPSNGNSRYYSFVRECILTPKTINLTTPVYTWTFEISDEEFKDVLIDVASVAGAPPAREFREGSCTYRLRCTRISSAEASYDESQWVTKKNIWPAHAFLELNSNMIELRRKQHHGNDLPADLTHYIRAGRNELKLSIMSTEKEKAGIYYAFAVEIVEITGCSTIKNGLTANHQIPASEVLEAIKTSLAAKTDDEDIAVVNSNITVQLSDPFTARIFEIPVRSTACLHRECFDLDTFLQTRKFKRPGWPCMPDEWRCPICGSDARPKSLRIDGFLAEVRASLAKQDLLETRAIVVEDNGSWQPKVEINEGEARDRTGGSKTPASATRIGAPLPPKNENVVINLEDE